MTNPPPPPASAMGLVASITEVMNLPDASGKGLALTGQGYVLLHNVRAALSLSEEEREAIAAFRRDDLGPFGRETLLALITRTYGENHDRR